MQNELIIYNGPAAGKDHDETRLRKRSLLHHSHAALMLQKPFQKLGNFFSGFEITIHYHISPIFFDLRF